MPPAEATSQSAWPEHLLRKHPVKRVYVGGRKTEPPVFSHVVNFPRLEVPLSGAYENQFEVDGKPVTMKLEPGTALFAPPNCWNLPTWRHRVQVVSLLFGKKQLGISLVTAKGGRSPGPTAQKFSRPMPLTGPIPKILEAMLELQISGGPVDIMPGLVHALLRCVGHFVLLPTPDAACSAKSLVEEVCVFLQGSYQHDVTRDSVARQFGVSPNYLSRVFQVQGHMTFSNYLLHVRIDRAKHLLASYNLKLDDIATRCGYRDTAYFCRVFKKVAKVTPADFRTQWRLAGARGLSAQ
jgi:AraC-like DNA-binding protein